MTTAVEVEFNALNDKIKGQGERCEKSKDQLWSAVNGIKNRLPIWATVIIALLTGGIGSLLTVIRIKML